MYTTGEGAGGRRGLTAGCTGGRSGGGGEGRRACARRREITILILHNTMLITKCPRENVWVPTPFCSA